MRYRAAVLAILAVIPSYADSRFRIAIVPHADLAPGKGQCEIRLEVDSEVRVTVRRDQVQAQTVSGEEPRDGGSECNIPLPARAMRDFAAAPLEGRGRVRVLEKPSPRNDYALVLSIADTAAGFGRYRVRLTWESAPDPSTDNPLPNPQNDVRPDAPAGFVWNNAITYRGRGAGESLIDDRGEPLGDVRADIDLGGKIVVAFTQPQPRGEHGAGKPVLFTGSVMAREGALIRADVVTSDHRLHGTMTLSVDEKQNVNSISLSATDGQEHLRLKWDRR